MRSATEGTEIAENRVPCPLSPLWLLLVWTVLSTAPAGAAQLAFENTARQAGVAKAGDAGAVAWFDMDGDGDEDLFVANLGPDRLYRNDGGRFTKVKKAGLGGGSDASLGVAVGDFDNDGLPDLFV